MSVVALSLMGCQANLRIDLNTDGIDNVGKELDDWNRRVSSEQQYQDVAKSLNDLMIRQTTTDYKYNRKFLNPIAHDIKIYARYGTTGDQCDDDQMAECLISIP